MRTSAKKPRSQSKENKVGTQRKRKPRVVQLSVSPERREAAEHISTMRAEPDDFGCLKADFEPSVENLILVDATNLKSPPIRDVEIADELFIDEGEDQIADLQHERTLMSKTFFALL